MQGVVKYNMLFCKYIIENLSCECSLYVILNLHIYARLHKVGELLCINQVCMLSGCLQKQNKILFFDPKQILWGKFSACGLQEKADE